MHLKPNMRIGEAKLLSHIFIGAQRSVKPDLPPFASLHVHSRSVSLTLIWLLVRYQKGSVDLIYWPCKHELTVTHVLYSLTRYLDWPSCTRFIMLPVFDCSRSSMLNSGVLSGWLTEKVIALCVLDSQINTYKIFLPNLLPQSQGTTFTPTNKVQMLHIWSVTLPPPMVWVHLTPHSHQVSALLPNVTPWTANIH